MLPITSLKVVHKDNTLQAYQIQGILRSKCKQFWCKCRHFDTLLIINSWFTVVHQSIHKSIHLVLLNFVWNNPENLICSYQNWMKYIFVITIKQILLEPNRMPYRPQSFHHFIIKIHTFYFQVNCIWIWKYLDFGNKTWILVWKYLHFDVKVQHFGASK